MELEIIGLLLFFFANCNGFFDLWKLIETPPDGIESSKPTQSDDLRYRQNFNTVAHFLPPLRQASSTRSSVHLTQIQDSITSGAARVNLNPASFVCKSKEFLSSEGRCRPCRDCKDGIIIYPCQPSKDTLCSFIGEKYDSLPALCKKYISANSLMVLDKIYKSSRGHLCLRLLFGGNKARENGSIPKQWYRRLRRRAIIKRSEKAEKHDHGENDKSLSKPQGHTNDSDNTTKETGRAARPKMSHDLQYNFDVLAYPVDESRPKNRQSTGVADKRTPMSDLLNGEAADDRSIASQNDLHLFNGPMKESGGKTTVTGSSRNGGIANWVYISIGATVVAVALSVFILTYVYRANVLVNTQRKELQRKEDLEADSFRRRDSQQDNESWTPHQGMNEIPLISLRNVAVYDCPENDRRRMGDGLGHDREAYEYDVPSCNATSRLLTRRASRERGENRAVRESTGSIYSMMKDDGNKLRGGNVEFHRRYVENPYVSNEEDSAVLKRNNLSQLHTKQGQANRVFSLASSSSESGWNGSSASSTTSHHSARSYISIPPTSPSVNYIEAGFDCLSLHSEKNTSPVKMEWLTKSFSLERKNVLSTYQASTGVQTENSVSPPMSKTVLGTPWQFGGEFTCQGGILQARDSDVVLSVPTGAVPKGQAIDIYGSVFTDTAEIRRKLEFPNFESLVTPVVEYLALPVNDFSRPLYLHLPHALPAEFDIDSVKIYTFTVDELGRVSTSCLPYRDQSSSPSNREAYWEKGQDGSKILIVTSHFSGYFCTLCKSTSLPSICTMVFGSHVQISQHRREIRVILYIWDRRLTIRDYLERFQKQESDVDRQLLTDMQVPLLSNASSDSRLVMRMEIMGSEEDRQCWQHVARPGGSRLLFKPLQVRRLSEIVQCCRQTDPIRVEWALENRPNVAASPVFQCCIDIMHAPESISDYEAALSKDIDDLMRTFYVRDLKVMNKEYLEPPPVSKFERTSLKRTLSEALDLKQTEQLCLELGITSKDIGNFHKKFSSQTEVRVELVEECLRRLGHEKFVSQLPEILERLHMSHLSHALEKDGSKQAVQQEGNPTSESAVTPKAVASLEDSSLTACKSIVSCGHYPSHLDEVACDRNGVAKNYLADHADVHHQRPHTIRHQVSEKSDGTSPSFVDIAPAPSLFGAYSSSAAEPPTNLNNSYHPNATGNKVDSSSGYESVNHQTALTFDNFNSRDKNFSMLAQANTLEVPDSDVEFADRSLASHTATATDCQAYPEITEELCMSTNGPKAFVGQRLREARDSNCQDDKDQTSKKEMYGIHTVV